MHRLPGAAQFELPRVELERVGPQVQTAREVVDVDDLDATHQSQPSAKRSRSGSKLERRRQFVGERLDLRDARSLILKTLDAIGPMHGYRIARRIEQIGGNADFTIPSAKLFAQLGAWVNQTLPELTIAQKSFTANVKIVSVGNTLQDDLNQLIR